MSEIKVNSIKGVSATSAAISINNSDGTCTANITNNLSNRNLIINGAMQVAQRGTSTTTSGDFGVDRFLVLFSGTDEAPTFAQHALTSSDTGPYAAGFRNSLHITNGDQSGGAGTNDYIAVDYRLEAQDIANSGWDYTSSSSFITFSYWIKSSVPQNFYVTLKTDHGTDQNYAFETGSLTQDTWTKITKTIPGNSNLQFDNNNTEGLRFRFLAFRGTDKTSSSYTLNTWGAYSSSARMPDNTPTWYTTNDATLEITGVQLEVGSVATDFEHRSFGQELALCQRYYYEHANGNNAQNNNRAAICSGGMYNSSNFFGVIQFPVKMRARPSLVKTTGTDYYRVYGANVSDGCNDVSSQNWSDQAFAVNLYDSLSLTQGSGGWAETNNASALIAFNSEL